MHLKWKLQFTEIKGNISTKFQLTDVEKTLNEPSWH